MKLSEMLIKRYPLLLNQRTSNDLVTVVAEWLYDHALAEDRAGHRGHTIRQLITDLHIEQLGGDVDGQSPVPGGPASTDELHPADRREPQPVPEGSPPSPGSWHGAFPSFG